VDLAFHFPGWSPRLQCRSLLIQLRLSEAPRPGAARQAPACSALLISGHDVSRGAVAPGHVVRWQPKWPHPPQPEVAQTLQQILPQLYHSAGPPVRAAESSR